MRMILNAEFDTATVNDAISEGRLAAVTEELLDDFQPEAAYFYAHNGRRSLTLVVEVDDAASLPRFAEPLWQQLSAQVEAIPCMTADELREGLAKLR
jgi:Domain of unknown function (DUF3303)